MFKAFYANVSCLCSVAMRQHSESIHTQERRWSEYVDRTNGQFTRSASARLPRGAGDDRADDDQEACRRRNSSDNRDPNAKSQQVSDKQTKYCVYQVKQNNLISTLAFIVNRSFTKINF